MNEMIPLKRLYHYIFKKHNWEYGTHLRWCIGCGWMQMNSAYPLLPVVEWIDFPLNGEELDAYFKEPKDQKYLSDELFKYLRRMEELGIEKC